MYVINILYSNKSLIKKSLILLNLFLFHINSPPSLLHTKATEHLAKYKVFYYEFSFRLFYFWNGSNDGAAATNR